MTEPQGARPRTVRLALLTGWLAAMPSLAFTVFWTVQLLTLRGTERFIMLNVLVAFAVGVWGWVTLAVVSLVLARRSSARSRAVLAPSVTALCATGACLVLALITLFQ